MTVKLFGQCGEMLSRLKIQGVAGNFSVSDSQLAYATIHWVSRGDNHYTVRITPDDVIINELEVIYNPNAGSLTFLHEFNDGEIINVVYEV